MLRAFRACHAMCSTIRCNRFVPSAVGGNASTMIFDLTEEVDIFNSPEIKTKMAILHAVDKSLDRMTVTEICKNANIPRQTFYRHFKSKFDIPWWHTIFCRQFFLDRIGRTMTWEEGYFHHLQLIVQEEDFYRKSLQYSINTPYGRTVLPEHRKKILVSTLRTYRGIEPNRNLMFLVDYFTKTETEVINDWFRSNEPVDIERWTDDLVSLIPHRLYAAIQMPEAQNIYESKLLTPEPSPHAMRHAIKNVQ